MRAVVARIPLVTLMVLLALWPALTLAQDAGSGDGGASRGDEARPGEDDAMRRLEGPEALSEAQLLAMSSSERQTLVNGSLDTMRAILTGVQGRLDKTRDEERDVLKLNCINEKLSAIKGFVKVAEKAQLGLQDAVNRQDGADQVHQTKLVQLADLRVKALGQEAEACSGDVVQYSGPANLDLDIDEDVRQDNPTDVDTSDINTDPLPDVSNYQ